MYFIPLTWLSNLGVYNLFSSQWLASAHMWWEQNMKDEEKLLTGFLKPS